MALAGRAEASDAGPVERAEANGEMARGRGGAHAARNCMCLRVCIELCVCVVCGGGVRCVRFRLCESWASVLPPSPSPPSAYPPPLLKNKTTPTARRRSPPSGTPRVKRKRSSDAADAPMSDVEAYLTKHGVTPMLNAIVNDLVREQPDDPISFLINGLLAEAGKAGQEPVLLQRLVELKKTLLTDQAEAVAAQVEKAKLATEVDKLSYRVKHLLKTMDDMESGGAAAPAGKPAASSTVSSISPAVTGIPLGHTSFSWAGGVQLAASAGGGSSAAPGGATGAADPLTKEAFSQRLSVVKIFKAGTTGVGREVCVSGWIRTVRLQKDLAFIALNDGSCMAALQLVVDRVKIGDGWRQLKELGGTGAAITATGELVASPGGQQEVELLVGALSVVGATDEYFPLAKKAHTLEHLRSLTHLRPRTNTFGAVMRIRNALSFATHSFFQSHGFMYVNTPLITGSDCEGAGEMFRVTTLDMEKLPRTPEGQVRRRRLIDTEVEGGTGISGSDCEGTGEMFRVTTLDMEKLPRMPEGRGGPANEIPERGPAPVRPRQRDMGGSGGHLQG